VTTEKLLIAGNPSIEHVGSHLYQAARAMGLETTIYDVRMAYQGNRWLAAAYWRIARRRPLRIGRYERGLLDRCVETGVSLVICVGIAPVTSRVLVELRQARIPVLNYLTDDPWNRSHFAPWFFEALPHYECVFSPRRANLADLKRSGVRHVCYLPFAYNPELHLQSPAEREEPPDADVVFVGGADRDRVPFISALIQAGFRLSLYGGYWDRYRETREYARGIVPPKAVKTATGNAKVALCLVRRANRDGHCMRSFEIPAMSGCMLAEDTEEHRRIFGAEGAAVLYFKSVTEMVEKARWLVDRPEQRSRLASAANELMVTGGHTYRHRLATMLDRNAGSSVVPGQVSH